MRMYRDITNDPSIRGYEIGDDYITVWLEGDVRPSTYKYDRAGRQHVERMKQLAKSGNGLNAYIQHFVKFDYDR
ncbi:MULTISPECIES: hypothetical protein [Vibrio]|uniref:KTSC domain-containing protein n=1 Tax=Vibrio proteolyticus NBRC 13287 TaxID=1219065 RepID=U3BB67_VIBPR|nr:MULTISPECIES: hypothetical protein [Vibrio]NAW58860.1 hypothetical protein [Vibrio sp. V36_P2S2PM302]NAX20514.1 hypothetical protein [Vibrio sp. V39_P1S14PM300]NAX26501.1 hypothetical protein [Vibrio sp. V38_P2S17PM301]NAX31381.1 hypothetical protein [Vibrio sp. V37_P2S8PM304]GAD67039.1 hypothetical protein VPR01S_06_00560 [Vibrio proteolyticus NBRC 13287]